MASRSPAIIGWIGTALVFAAVGIRFLKPEWAQYAQYAAWAGLACVLVYLVGQWRDIGHLLRAPRRGTARCRSSASWRCSASSVAVNYLASRQNKRWDLTVEPGLQPVGSDRQGAARPRRAGEVHRVRSATNVDRAARDRLDEYTYQSPKVTPSTSTPTRTRPRAKAADVTRYGTMSSSTRTAPSASPRSRSRT